LRGERLHILVLDDDPAITEVIEDVLGAECSITVANTIDEASAALEVACYDVLLCDPSRSSRPNCGR
jgi:CheY-like chemotaxis protein